MRSDNGDVFDEIVLVDHSVNSTSSRNQQFETFTERGDMKCNLQQLDGRQSA